MLIDSNILIYSINTDSPKHKKSQQFLQENLRNLEIAHQNILETIRVLTHQKFSNPMSLDMALTATQAITQSCRIISPTQTSYYLFLELIKKHNLVGNRIFYAYLAATALSNGIATIATDNVSDFKKFQGLRIINPFF
ncbi:PIN domain-containing protein [Candidatus Daviesbacteria bacterium]|nr:PIN domain-containing protein [Candidatus Daviesbacteria bacterium]